MFSFLHNKQIKTLVDNLSEEVHIWQVIRNPAGQIITWSLIYVNPPTLKTWGFASVQEISGKTPDEMFGDGATEHYIDTVRKVMKERIPFSFLDYFPNLDRHFRFTTIPFEEYFITTGVDITDFVKEKESILVDNKSLELLVNERTNQLNKTVHDLKRALEESQKLREDLRNQAMHDHLTGLFNRRFMEEYLKGEIERSRRSEQRFGIILLDIDHFKQVNDTYGHQAGDAILVALGKLLQKRIRGGDTACRYGGEEFLMILPETPLKNTAEKAEKFRTEAKRIRHIHNGLPSQISISLGVAEFPRHGNSIEELIHAADRALYLAKNTGRDRVVSANEIAIEDKMRQPCREDHQSMMDCLSNDPAFSLSIKAVFR